MSSDTCLMELFTRIAQKDEIALAELYEYTRNVLMEYVRKFVRDSWNAEEVLQDVYKYVWLNAAAYTPDRGAPQAWLYMIARSRALDSLRRSKKDVVQSEFDERRHRLSIGDVETEHARSWWSAVVQRSIGELPPAQREMIGLAFYEGYTHSQIADETGLPLGTVKARIRMALTKLREALPAEQMQYCRAS